jgi:glutathione S-transferase
MAEGRLFIGTRRYSSWSLRGWLAVRIAGLDVDEVIIPLAGGNTAAIKATTPAGMVPYLEHRGAKIWESLAIAEYCAEFCPKLWPAERVARAAARSAASEMHAGFRVLRQAMPMILGREDLAGGGQNPESLADIARIDALWCNCRENFGASGRFLFGADFTNADVMFAPVVARLRAYRPKISATAEAYCDAVRQFNLVDHWYRQAAEEPLAWRIDKYELPS